MSRGYRAIWKDGKLLAEFEGDECVFLSEAYSVPDRSELSAPSLIRDYHEPFKSMADGKTYDSKSAYRRSLAAQGYAELGNDASLTGKPFGASAKSETRKKLLHKQLADVSDREADKVLKQLRKQYAP